MRRRIQASAVELVSLIIFESSGTQFLVTIFESSGIGCADESRRQLGRHLADGF